MTARVEHHRSTDHAIFNPWYLWFRPIRGVLACSCERWCSTRADVYGMVGGSFGSAPFMACAQHWEWLLANGHVRGGHSGSVLGVGPDCRWGGVGQNLGSWADPFPEAPAAEEASDQARGIGPGVRSTFKEFLEYKPIPECHRGRQPGVPPCG